MIETITIDKIYRNETKKDGSFYMDKFTGDRTVSVVIVANGGKTYYGFDNYEEAKAKMLNFKPGDQVTIDVKENGDYLNFKLPSGEKAELEAWKQSVEDRLFALEAHAQLGGHTRNKIDLSEEDFKEEATDKLPWEE